MSNLFSSLRSRVPLKAAWSLLLVPIIVVAVVLMTRGGDDPPSSDGTVSGPGETIVIPEGQPIVIGVSVPLTGPDAALGKEDLDAVLVAVERWKVENGDTIAGHEIVVRAEDDGCTEGDIAAMAAENLVQHPGVVAVIGPNCSDGALAAVPIYSQWTRVAISGSATLSGLAEEQPDGRFFFRTAYRNDIQGALIGLFIAFDLDARRAYLVDDGEPYGVDLAEISAQYLERGGVEVIREGIPRGAVDFGDTVDRIMRADPDIVIFAGFNPEGVLLYRQLRDAGYTGLFGAGDAAASFDSFVEPAGDVAEGVLFSGCAMQLSDDFARDFDQLHGYQPTASAFTAQHADAATILLNAIAAVAAAQDDGSVEIDPAGLRDALASAVLGDGQSGAIAFDENGDRVPPDTRTLPEFVDAALLTQDLDRFYNMGLVPCQVQDGGLVNLLGPGAREIRLP